MDQQIVFTNVVKRFLHLVHKHFPKSVKLHKIFKKKYRKGKLLLHRDKLLYAQQENH